MRRFFAVLIQEHKKFGQVLYPFLLEDSGKNYFDIIDRISMVNLDHYHSLLSIGKLEIVMLVEEYNDLHITKRFTNQRISARDFVKKVEPEYVAKFIRPFIEKQMAKCIAIMAAEKIPMFFRETKNVVYRADEVKVESEPAKIVFNFIKMPHETHYFQTIRHNENVISLTGKSGMIITNKPCWLLLDRHLFHFTEEVDGKKLEIFFNKEFISVPERIEKEYYSTFVKKCIRDFPVYTEGISIKEVITDKRAALSLENDLQGLPGLFLYLIYGEKTFTPNQTSQVFVKFNGDISSPAFEILKRDKTFEKLVEESLTQMGLVAAGENKFLVDTALYPERQTNKYALVNWLNQNTKKLTEKGFEIRQELGNANYYTGFVEMEIGLNEDNDWFDIHAIARFGEEFEIPVFKLRNHLIEGIREYLLPDGRIAILPEEWFVKYTGLVTFGVKTKNGIRVHKTRTSLVQEAFDEKLKQSIVTLEEIGRKMLAKKPQIPEGLKVELRSYQKEGFQWFEFLKKYRLGGCLADDMGLGKTLQTITLLLQRKNELHGQQKILPTATSRGQLVLFSDPEPGQFIAKPSLVVMPASLIHNWVNEINKFAPGLMYLNYTGPQRFDLVEKFNQVNLILTTYGTIRNDLKELEAFNFDYIILDESQIIKNPQSKIARSVLKLNSSFKITLSGTPIENNLTDLWSQMNFLNRGLLGDQAFFKRYFANPIEKNGDKERLEKLQTLIRPMILRRTKAEVEKELPDLIEDFIFCEMTTEQQKFYLEEKSSIRNYILESIEREGSSNAAIVVLQALTRLRQIANHPILINPDYKYGSGKFGEVIRNIETLVSGGHKVLVFSSFVRHLEIFAAYFIENNIGFSMLTGKTQNREEVITRFQKESSRNVFLISIKAGGVGLNLTQAGYVFLLEPWWNPAVELQAISRSHRIGQSSHVFAYRYITLGTIEEKILRLQQKKSRLSEMFIRSDNPIKHLNVNDIKELID
ncbi:MAG: DEAD/DEAH box helicase [Bacteroidales bacterium]|nr:DEAD/DEAH box helicase [Bacteroidales bacterium]